MKALHLSGFSLIIIPAVLLCTPYAHAADRANIYDETTDSRADIAKALSKAESEGKHVLLQWGGNWCGWCHLLHELFNDDERIRSVLAESYEIVMIDSRSNKDLAEELGSQIGSVPFLTILNAGGTKLLDQRTEPLEVGNRHDPEKVLAFLNKWKPAPKSATNILEKATARAAKSDKRLFVKFSTQTCGWCKRLNAYMDRPQVKDIFNKYYMSVEIDQGTLSDGASLRAKLGQGRAGGGVPWFAILDADGKTLSTATGPGGNIGYPLEPEGVVHFMKMIEQTAPKISPDELGTIESELKAMNAEIMRQRGR